ncbi:MAG: hypothetical protein K2X91_03410 [Thermoleophilia bacterium]|nr:hypothetical protein [Thermoleophilia bacterium]
MPGTATTCLNCDQTLSPLQRAVGDRFCGHSCRWSHAAPAAHQVCSVCGRRLPPQQLGLRSCATRDCREAAAAAEREREHRRRIELERRALALRERAGGTLGVRDPGAYPLTVIPSSKQVLANIPERRRRKFRDTLNRLISEAAAAGPPPPPTPDAEPAPPPESTGTAAALNAACGLCRGWCCEQGGDHAYLTIETLRRVLHREPKPRPRDVLDAYLGRVGHRSYRGSCLFHQDGGCALPRDLRSDTCNRFYCTGLTDFRRRVDGGDPARAFFVSAHRDEIRAAGFCDEDGLRPAPADEEPGPVE